ncbi:glutamate-1-semialdehyde 2,1-aminomutase [Methanonatronarchaeum sp. AMET6-2]|uniref:glutamate-1-semialdehyde 2,1-aminomutase n=1 Tax=Methanonatronarchaeum sp. AMET6-2 TaxID=2933293 RepID=UPI0011FDFAB5|nr:glutamate-1-semialdehyde 2,1-aminomutase [Methanonatronarchaeum sp. AMET6-2]RZN63311.1 MAG: glutamate-1-semialdehyde-2,1-aminomutase [Methanonatronarchaeia archaeon]UOY10312.1 glutamate-1-semialdehyde 2,1-aminomutase [Methanonatronarchaeum sp. AMET6-2]
MDDFRRSKELFMRSQDCLVGGVNSPARSYSPFPIFMEDSEGSKIYDVDGNEFIDYSLAFGPQIFGHRHPRIKQAVERQLERGWAFGTSTEKEIELAELVSRHYPSIDKLRVVNTGTEATMSAIRLARGYTGRDKIVKFEGGFHGAHDSVLVQAGSGASTHGAPDSPGVPRELAEKTIVLPWNDKERIKGVFEEIGGEIACVIAEPVFGNAGCIPPKNGFLELIRDLTREYGSLFVLDEVITGYRVSMGGAQELFGLEPDLTTLGKIAGGGYPIGMFGGQQEIMNHLSPEGDVYQAGTFSGNPVTTAASVEAIKLLEDDNVIEKANNKGREIRSKLSEAVSGLPVNIQGLSSMFSIFLTDQEVMDYSDIQKCDFEAYTEFHREMAKNGVYLPPSQYELCFISYVHSEEEIENTADVVGEVLEKVL